MQNDRVKKASLKKMQRLATSLLILMGVIFAAAGAYEKTYGWLGFVRAFAEAGIVGALADWFAVTALFRYPFGLRLPHTAIIPTNKDRIGESLGKFVEKNFLTPEAVSDKLRSFDLAGRTTEWLGNRANSRLLVDEIASFLPRLLESLDDHDIRRFVRRGAVSSIQSINLAPLFGEFLTVLTSKDKHQVLFDQALLFIEDLFEKIKPDLQTRITAESNWIFLLLNGDTKLYNKIVTVIKETLDQIAGNPGHELRNRFNDAMGDFIRHLKESSEYAAKVETMKQQIIRNRAVSRYLDDVWADLRQAILDDVGNPESAVRKSLEDALRTLYTAFLGDAAVREKMNFWIRSAVAQTVSKHRSEISNLIAEQVKKWDAETMTKKLELEVGKDLQYIRINGTVIGGCIGLLIHVISRLF